MPDRVLAHLFPRNTGTSEKYGSFGRGPNIAVPLIGNPTSHGTRLINSIRQAQDEADGARRALEIQIGAANPGVYIQCVSYSGFDIPLDRLEDAKHKIQVVAVRRQGEQQLATIFVPSGKVRVFLKKFDRYLHGARRKHGKRQNEELINNLKAIKAATLNALWTDEPDQYPQHDELVWWEVWLRNTSVTVYPRFRLFSENQGITLDARRLEFPDRIVCLALARESQLSASIIVLGDLAEIRKPRKCSSDIVRLGNVREAELSTALLQRTTQAADNSPCVCLLDTGVNRGHQLLERAIPTGDLHTCNAAWNVHDHTRHGTGMAGLSLYGDLNSILGTDSPIILRHALESVVVIPPVGMLQTKPELHGAVIAHGVSLPETERQTRRRCFTLAVTNGKAVSGSPTSSSAAVDALAVGRSFDTTKEGLVYLSDGPNADPRLFLVSTGNVRDFSVNHIETSEKNVLEDPGQCWNGITVGACTFLRSLRTDDPGMDGYEPLAEGGELSPYSRSAIGFDGDWPLKPEIVLEGGNLARKGNTIGFSDSLTLLSTHHKPGEGHFATFDSTSASTALAARICATISAEYPSLWPETIRALLVHSAEWTPAMMRHIRQADNKGQLERVLQKYGFGVPDLRRALKSAKNATTLVVQDTLRPFKDKKLDEMRLHQLPWPKEILAELWNEETRLRVTLSYFVEPNPGNRGWTSRHRYASHLLRFETQLPSESETHFRRRVNKLALAEEEKRPKKDEDKGWLLGSRLRFRGSIHSDVWTGSAVKLAGRSAIAIYPVSGWWKTQPKWDRSQAGVRYSLVVSIETDNEEADLWNEIRTQIELTAS